MVWILTTTSVTGNLTGNVTGNTSGSSGCTGNAATATALQTTRTIEIGDLDGTGNINLPEVNTSGTQRWYDNAATATKIDSITNSDIVQLNSTQTLTNKTLTSPTITGTGAIAGTFTGNITGNVKEIQVDLKGHYRERNNSNRIRNSKRNRRWIF